MNRLKSVVLFFILIISFVLASVNYAAAAEGDVVTAVDEEDLPEGMYSDNVPYLYHLEYIVHANGGENRLGGDFYNLNKNINAFEFLIPIVDGIIYEDYYVVFDFTLKSQLEDGTITTHTYKEQFDIAEDYSPGWLDNLFISLGLKENAFDIYFNFGKLVSNSPDIIKKEKYIVNASDNVPVLSYDYNTIVSRIDAYFVKKTTGEYGMIQRFDMTWHEDFYYSCCVSIDYCLFKPDTNDVLDAGSLSDDTGVYGYDSSGDNALLKAKGVIAQISNFVADIPLVIYEIAVGIYDVSDSLVELFIAYFPFVSPEVIKLFGVFLIIGVLFGVYKLIRG